MKIHATGASPAETFKLLKELYKKGEEMNEGMVSHEKAAYHVLTEEELNIFEDERKTSQQEIVDSLMPDSGQIIDFEFGTLARGEDEDFEHYQIRRKTEKEVLKRRLRGGINNWDTATKGQFTSERRQTIKKLKAMELPKKLYKQVKKSLRNDGRI